MPEKKSAGSLRHTGDPLEENLTFTEAYLASILRAIIINVFLYLVSTAWQFDGFHSAVGVGHQFHAWSIGTVSTFHTHHGEVAHTCHSLNGGHSWCACGNVVKTVGIERSDGPAAIGNCLIACCLGNRLVAIHNGVEIVGVALACVVKPLLQSRLSKAPVDSRCATQIVDTGRHAKCGLVGVNDSPLHACILVWLWSDKENALTL